MDQRIKNLAKILIYHSARISEGDQVASEATPAAGPLVQALYRSCYARP